VCEPGVDEVAAGAVVLARGMDGVEREEPLVDVERDDVDVGPAKEHAGC
jgi:hypothetical protein